MRLREKKNLYMTGNQWKDISGNIGKKKKENLVLSEQVVRKIIEVNSNEAEGLSQ